MTSPSQPEGEEEEGEGETGGEAEGEGEVRGGKEGGVSKGGGAAEAVVAAAVWFGGWVGRSRGHYSPWEKYGGSNELLKPFSRK